MKFDTNKYSHMSDLTFKLMKRIDGRLDRYTDHVLVQCGHEELMERSFKSRDRLTDFIAVEFEKLVVENSKLSKSVKDEDPDEPNSDPVIPDQAKFGDDGR